MMKLARYLKESREKAGLTQTEVAAKLGYGSSQFVSNWERGRSFPPMNTLRPLSKLYRVDMDEMFELICEITLMMTEESLKKQYSKIKKRRAS